MCARPGKILSSPGMSDVVHSPASMSVEARKHHKYMLKVAVRRAVGDMEEILRGENAEMAAFLEDELARLAPRGAAPRTARGPPDRDAGIVLEDEFW